MQAYMAYLECLGDGCMEDLPGTELVLGYIGVGLGSGGSTHTT